VFLVARRGARLPAAGLRAALGRLLECAGLVLAFYALNVGVGFAAVLVLRKVTGGFVSAYLTTDDTLAVLSALQAVAFQWWRAEGERP
jgi:hypothetical protein